MYINKLPLVSVIMITYNHEKFIYQAIEGVLMQEYNGEIELIIANDHSTDKTDEVIWKIINTPANGFRIKYTNHKANKGSSDNSIWALNQARGKYIAYCEGDDYWVDSLKLQKQVDFLEAHPEYGLVCSNSNVVDENGNDIKDENVCKAHRLDFSLNEITFDLLLQYNKVFTLTVCLKKEYFDSVCKNKPAYAFDYWIWLRFSAVTKIYKMGDFTASYRYHSGGISRNPLFFRERMPFVFLDCIKFYLDAKRNISFKVLKAIFHKVISLNLHYDLTSKQRFISFGLLLRSVIKFI